MLSGAKSLKSVDFTLNGCPLAIQAQALERMHTVQNRCNWRGFVCGYPGDELSVHST